MCIDFDGHHSSGSSFDSVIRCGPIIHRCQLALKKKIRSRVPVLSLASRKPVRIRRSGRIGIRDLTGHLFSNLLNLSQATYRLSSSPCWNTIISLHLSEVRDGEKNLPK